MLRKYYTCSCDINDGVGDKSDAKLSYKISKPAQRVRKEYTFSFKALTLMSSMYLATALSKFYKSFVEASCPLLRRVKNISG